MSQNTFERRFSDVLAKMRQTKVLHAISCTALALAAGVTGLATIDYWFEVAWSARAVGLVVLLVVSVAWGISLVWRVLARWGRNRAAAKIEQEFPELGQLVRTTVQFHGPDPEEDALAAGASLSLVKALKQDVDDRTGQLPLPKAVPTQQLRFAALSLAGAALLFAIACIASWQWRMAAARTLLANSPYTTMSVEPGDALVEEKETLTLATELAGRTNRDVTLWTRPVGKEDAVWTERSLTEDDRTAYETRLVRYEMEIPKIKAPFEYRVVAGRYESPTHRVDVRYPIEVKSVRVDLTSPAYTGVPPQTINNGSFHALEGSRAEFQIELDRPVPKAWLELTNLQRSIDGDQQEKLTIDCAVAGATLRASMDITEDQVYTVYATADEDTRMRPNRFRIRVKRDRPPRLDFIRPRAGVEVTSLAEVLMRLRISDDYGLTSAGIIFQINNEEPYHLLELKEADFQEVDESSGEVSKTLKTKAIVEKLLPLEYFDLTQKDSVTFYAYAEDNLPGERQRGESDLHFIDVRPFRLRYVAPQGGGTGGRAGGGFQITALQELIGRERFILNRSIRIARQAERNQGIDLKRLDDIMAFQNETAELTGEAATVTAEAEDFFDIQEDRTSDLLFAAEEQMLAAIDSMSVGKYDTGVLQEKDALRYLIDARFQLEIRLGQRGGSAFAARLFAFNRRMMQRLRRPKSDRERADEVVRQLRSLADRQDSMSQMLREMMAEMARLQGPDTPMIEPEEEDADNLDQDQSEEEDLIARREQLEDQQSDIALEVEDAARVIDQLQAATNLARARAQNVAQAAMNVSGAMERGRSGRALTGAGMASAAYRQLAWHVEGISQLESVQRIAVARDLATRAVAGGREIDERSREVGALKERDEADATNAVEEMVEALAGEADLQAELGRTVVDILQSVRDSFDQEGDPAIARIERMMDELKLDETVDRMDQLAGMIQGDRFGETSVQAADIADRFDIAAQQLDTLYRQMVAPRVEQLRLLEARAVDLDERLAALDAEDQVTRWHRRAEALMEDLREGQIAEAAVAQLTEAMKEAGWEQPGREAWNWPAAENGLAAPAAYGEATRGIVQEIQRHIQELIVGDMLDDTDDAVPPKYLPLVERYMEVLSADVSMTD